jgi:hypothetical protein
MMSLSDLVQRSLEVQSANREKESWAVEQDFIKAAAGYWRDRLAHARIGCNLDQFFETTVTERYTELELDRFEQALIREYCSQVVYNPKSCLFTERGAPASLPIKLALMLSDTDRKIAHLGIYYRMRILPTEVAYEEAPGRYQVIWRMA